MISPEIIATSGIIHTASYIYAFRKYIHTSHTHMSTCVCITIIKEKETKFEIEQEEGYTEGFGGRKWK